MPEPTLQDVMDKLEDLDGDIQDVKQQCNQINPIKSKCDELLDKDKIWQQCTSCKGVGYRIEHDDYPTPHQNQIPCIDCNETGKIRWGQQENIE